MTPATHPQNKADEREAQRNTVAQPVEIDVVAGPTPDQVDAIIARYESAQRLKAAAVETEREAKHSLISLMRIWSVPAAGSEHSHIINGALNTAMLTDVTSTSLDEEKVREFYELLAEEQRSELFGRIFGTRIKHELVAGAEDVLRIADMPKWLRAKAKALFGECIKVSNSAPRIKVDLLIKEPKVRKPRTTKAVQA